HELAVTGCWEAELAVLEVVRGRGAGLLRRPGAHEQQVSLPRSPTFLHLRELRAEAAVRPVPALGELGDPAECGAHPVVVPGLPGRVGGDGVEAPGAELVDQRGGGPHRTVGADVAIEGDRFGAALTVELLERGHELR